MADPELCGPPATSTFFSGTTKPVSQAQPRHELKDFADTAKEYLQVTPRSSFSGMKVELFISSKASPFMFLTAEAKVLLGTAEIKLLLHAWL